MATAVHIPVSEVRDVKTLLDMANEGAVVVERGGESYQITRRSGRTATEILALMKDDPKANVAVDEDWAKDMEEIIARRHSEPDRDPWA